LQEAKKIKNKNKDGDGQNAEFKEDGVHKQNG